MSGLAADCFHTRWRWNYPTPRQIQAELACCFYQLRPCEDIILVLLWKPEEKGGKNEKGTTKQLKGVIQITKSKHKTLLGDSSLTQTHFCLSNFVKLNCFHLKALTHKKTYEKSLKSKMWGEKKTQKSTDRVLLLIVGAELRFKFLNVYNSQTQGSVHGNSSEILQLSSTNITPLADKSSTLRYLFFTIHEHGKCAWKYFRNITVKSNKYNVADKSCTSRLAKVYLFCHYSK